MLRTPTASLLVLLLSTWSTFASGAVKETQVSFDHLEGSAIHFKSTGDTPKPIKTDLFEIRYLSTLKGEDPQVPPYYLISGKPCQSCNQPHALFVYRSTQPKPVATFVYPGRVIDPKTKATLFESRAFFGRCLFRQKADVYISFQKDRVDRRRGLQSSVFVATPSDDHLEEKLYERGLPRIQDTQKLVKAKQCFEIDGKSRLMLTKPLDLTPRRQTDEDEDDEDDEKNTDKPDTADALEGTSNGDAVPEASAPTGTPSPAPSPSASPSPAPQPAPSPSAQQ